MYIEQLLRVSGAIFWLIIILTMVVWPLIVLVRMLVDRARLKRKSADVPRETTPPTRFGFDPALCRNLLSEAMLFPARLESADRATLRQALSVLDEPAPYSMLELKTVQRALLVLTRVHALDIHAMRLGEQIMALGGLITDEHVRNISRGTRGPMPESTIPCRCVIPPKENTDTKP